MVAQDLLEFPEWDPTKEYSSIARPSEYTTASGHRVNLQSLHIQYFLRGFLEGHPDCWRALVLQRLPAKAKWLFPDQNGLVVEELVEGIIPRYVLLAEFSDYSSGLVVCWFAEDERMRCFHQWVPAEPLSGGPLILDVRHGASV